LYIKVILTSIGSILVLFLLSKIIGNKQMSQTTLFDYVNSITIGSIAAEMAISNDENFFVPLIAMVIYGFAAAGITVLTTKSLKFRRFLNGRCIILMDDDRIYMKNLKKAKIDLNELLTQFRLNGYFDVSDIHSAYLEPNGMISILPKEKARTTTPKDLNLSPKQTKATVILVIDGTLLENNLHFASVNRQWLESMLKTHGAENISDVALASVDSEKNMTVFLKNGQAPSNDYFG
jgi:uncharacterized membrane protein YcaP (DUF421 family)